MSSLDTDTPTDFPFLTTDEFSTACRHLISQAHWPDAFVTKLHEELVGKLNVISLGTRWLQKHVKMHLF